MRRWVVILLLLVVPCLFAQEVSKKGPAPRIVSTITKAKVLKRVNPVYPEGALKRGVFGPVVIDMIIDKQGAPKSMHVIKGDPALAKAVLEALRQWRWEPYKLNGEPVEVESSMTVNFEPR